jgi:hypothetical protein
MAGRNNLVIRLISGFHEEEVKGSEQVDSVRVALGAAPGPRKIWYCRRI